ncbi:Bax inhibitor 1 [Perkinsus olseni]|uniref:Bax inhibitor 1 n=4 Tax=Perkinsus olseni TaxID=32597 RepID=A0A7J6MFA3_PEROL|nr:Bax inhibitor 1 [Perkinsus olseni]KAF4673991.1 Bax inhibitor 1 [Perkinsus olseni]
MGSTFGMQNFTNIFNTASRFNPSAVLSFKPLDAPARKHLQKIYGILTIGVACTAAGCWFHVQVAQIGSFITAIMSIALLMGSMYTTDPYSDRIDPKRLAMFAGFAFLKGVSLGPLIYYSMAVDPDLLMTAFYGTLAIFACLSACAIFSRRREWLYLGSILSSVMLYMALVNLGNIFFRSNLVFNLNLYGLLLVFMGYVLLDTQVAIESFYSGYRDPIKAAGELYTDLVAIFVRILVILMRNSEERRKDGDRRRRR